MKRVRRRTVGLSFSALVHIIAFLVLTRVILPDARTRVPRPDAVMQVQIIRLRDGLGRQSPPQPDQPSPVAPASPQAPPEPPADVIEAPPPDEAQPSVVAQNAPLDIDPLFQAPFRDAIGQAAAALRAGLGCAHVNLQQLPPDLLQQCVAAQHRKSAKTPPTTPESPPADGQGADLKA